jgi:LuxR family maltose regulon positive regulatory protein
LNDRSLQPIEATRRDLGEHLEQSELKWECLALRAMLLALEDQSAAGAKLARECLPHLGGAWICNVLFNVIGFGDLQACDWKAFYTLSPVLPMPQRSARYLVTLTYRHCLVALGEISQGRLAPAATLLQEAIRQATPGIGTVEPYASPVLRGLPAALLAFIRYQEGRLDEARLLSLESLEIIKQAGFLDCLALGASAACRLAAQQGNSLGARAVLEETEILAQNRDWPRLSALMLLERARLALLEHNRVEAGACTQQLQALLPNLPRVGSNQGLVSLAQLWMAAGDAGAELDREQLQADLDELRRSHAPIRLSELLIAQAMLEDDVTGATVLLEAKRLMEQSGAYQVLLDYPDKTRLAARLESCASHAKLSRRQHEQLVALLARLQQDGQIRSVPSYDLTAKEREILTWSPTANPTRKSPGHWV